MGRRRWSVAGNPWLTLGRPHGGWRRNDRPTTLITLRRERRRSRRRWSLFGRKGLVPHDGRGTGRHDPDGLRGRWWLLLLYRLENLDRSRRLGLRLGFGLEHLKNLLLDKNRLRRGRRRGCRRRGWCRRIPKAQGNKIIVDVVAVRGLNTKVNGATTSPFVLGIHWPCPLFAVGKQLGRRQTPTAGTATLAQGRHVGVKLLGPYVMLRHSAIQVDLFGLESGNVATALKHHLVGEVFAVRLKSAMERVNLNSP